MPSGLSESPGLVTGRGTVMKGILVMLVIGLATQLYASVSTTLLTDGQSTRRKSATRLWNILQSQGQSSQSHGPKEIPQTNSSNTEMAERPQEAGPVAGSELVGTKQPPGSVSGPTSEPADLDRNKEHLTEPRANAPGQPGRTRKTGTREFEKQLPPGAGEKQFPDANDSEKRLPDEPRHGRLPDHSSHPDELDGDRARGSEREDGKHKMAENGNGHGQDGVLNSDFRNTRAALIWEEERQYKYAESSVDLGLPLERAGLRLPSDCDGNTIGDDHTRCNSPHFECNGLSKFMRFVSENDVLITQAPERGDGIGSRMWARVQVMVLAQAMGMRYTHVPIRDTVPIFGPTEGGQRFIDWETFLNAGQDYSLAESHVSEGKRSGLTSGLSGDSRDEFESSQAEGNVVNDEDFRTVDIVQLLNGMLIGESVSKGASADRRRRLYSLEHGSVFSDDPCIWDHLGEAYRSVSMNLHRNYMLNPNNPLNHRADGGIGANDGRDGPPENPHKAEHDHEISRRHSCHYHDDSLDVALHIRRGDVLPGDPEKLMRCGKPLFTRAQRQANHELRNPFFHKNWVKRGNDFDYYKGIMLSILSTSKLLGLKVRFHIYSQTASSCEGSFIEDFPELEFQHPGKRNGSDDESVLETNYARRLELRAKVKGEPGELGEEWIRVVLNSDPRESFHCLVTADVLAVAKSTFSLVAGMMSAPDQIRLYPPVTEGWEHKGSPEWLQADARGSVDTGGLFQAMKILNVAENLGLAVNPEDISFSQTVVKDAVNHRTMGSLDVTFYRNFTKVNFWTTPDYDHNFAKCGSDYGAIKFLGVASTPESCLRKCVETQRCWSFTWFPREHMRFESAVDEGRMWYTRDRRCPNQCFGITEPGAGGIDHVVWAVSGDVHLPCLNDDDCSQNGKCNTTLTPSRCSCRKPWEGFRCEKLSLSPLQSKDLSGYRIKLEAVAHSPKNTNENGEFRYREPSEGREEEDGKDDDDDEENEAEVGEESKAESSSWGGTVVKGPDGMFHMWVSEMAGHCGIVSWGWNSRIVHATSEKAIGPYQRIGTVFGIFAHEPRVVPLPSPSTNATTLAMFFTGDIGRKNRKRRCYCCRIPGRCDGSTEQGDCPFKRVFAEGGAIDEVERNSATYVTEAANPEGPWSEPKIVAHGDANLSPIVFEDGSLLGLVRQWGVKASYGSHMKIVVAKDWRSSDSYVTLGGGAGKGPNGQKEELFPNIGSAGVEDPFVYRDSAGTLHAVFHHIWGAGSGNRWWSRTTSGHAFLKMPSDSQRMDKETEAEYHARVGEWIYTGVIMGNETAVTPDQRRFHIDYRDGTSEAFTRLERPNLIFGESTVHEGTPTHIVLAAQTGKGVGSTVESSQGASWFDDKSHTIVIPLSSAN
eukprot:CAMPEP_0114493586 /NCGR_PEP_ID=MMETSP0109-20121206/4186_1 /TAXON_ID=29199 /ORGANISM="Chlorarachnion reptans, Strain CCCM449" /LENGTH=1380 /DNA_ID=CAMNT_0001670543 /DNA_START=68 /DNA_END=4210 /DNA_ORIENTATION=+